MQETENDKKCMDRQTELNKMEWWIKHVLIPKINFPAAQTSPVTHIKQLQDKLLLFARSNQ